MAKMQNRIGRHLCVLFVGIIITPTLICGCGHLNRRFQAESIFKEANAFFGQGDYAASLSKYEQIIEKYPSAADRVLFEMGIIYSYPRNEEKDYQKSLECFQKLINDYPRSEYRKDSEMMVFHINNVVTKDKTIATQQTQIETLRQIHIENLQQKDNAIAAQQTLIERLRQTQVESLERKDKTIAGQQTQIENLYQELRGREEEIYRLQKEIEMVEKRIFAIKKGPADKILIEKKERRLALISRGEVLKTYKIALGGNPDGPKERQGDNKTPEGTYIIDSKNKDSGYHLSLHISYPNEKDKKRAKELGVSPGGDIMIHGIKNGFSWARDFHTEVDWTKGCIAVTDEEIEEISNLVPNGIIVEITP